LIREKHPSSAHTTLLSPPCPFELFGLRQEGWSALFIRHPPTDGGGKGETSRLRSHHVLQEKAKADNSLLKAIRQLVD